MEVPPKNGQVVTFQFRIEHSNLKFEYFLEHSSHWTNSINSNSIPFANFGIGIDPQFKFQSWNWCHNSNSNSTELGGFQGIPMFVLKSVEKVEKTCEPGVTSSLFELPVTPGWREANSNMWNPLESPQFR